MLGLLTQIKILVLTLTLGVIAGFILHSYQLFVRSLKAGKKLLYLLDFIFWLFMILLISLGMLLINQGALRLYTFVILILGGAIYYKTLAPRFSRPLLAISGFEARLIKSLLHQAVRPGAWLINKLRMKWRNRFPSVPPDDPGL